MQIQKKGNFHFMAKTIKKVSKKIDQQEEKVVTSAQEVTSKKPQTMEELLAKTSYNLVIPKKGEVVKGKIVAKDKKSIRVDIGSKTEGVIDSKDYDFARDYIEDLKVGDEIETLVLRTENEKGQVVLSLKNAATDSKWDYFKKALDTEEILEAKGLEINKGGLIISINGVRGFVPSSQFGRSYVGKIKDLKNKKIKVRAIEVDREKNRLIFSERHVSEAEQLAFKDKALDMVTEEGIYEGVVSGVMPFGLFVTVEVPVDQESKSVGYVEGLIHISEISWEKVNHPQDFHQVGDRVKVKVLGIDEKTGKLNLSIKQLSEDPWKNIAEKFPIGTTFSGVVSRIEPFGVFVNVEPGVDGLIHSSKLEPSANYKVGDKLTVNVEAIEPENRRMSLSVVLTEVPMGYK